MAGNQPAKSGGANAPSPSDQEKIKAAEEEAAAKSKGKKLVFTLQHPTVKTDAKTAMYFKGSEKTLDLKDGILKTDDSDLYDVLKREGWIDKTEYPVLPNAEQHAAQKLPSKWFFRHPLVDEKNKGNWAGATVAFYVNGEGKSLKLDKDGKLTTDDYAVAEKLEQAAYILEKTE